MINFKGRRFEKEIILLCVRWYVAYPLSYQNLKEMMEERGVEVDHSNVFGFKAFYPAQTTLAGIEVAHMLRKKQLSKTGIPAYQQFMALTG